MEIKDMIAVLQAAERGEKIEWLNRRDGLWVTWKMAFFNFVDYTYRIAPKKEMTLVEEARLYAKENNHPIDHLVRRLADRIEELEAPDRADKYFTTDELLDELKRRIEG